MRLYGYYKICRYAIILLFLLSTVHAVAECSAVFEGNITKSKIILNCSRKIPDGIKSSLESILNNKFTKKNNNECNPEFKGNVTSTELTLRCGYSAKDVQNRIDELLQSYAALKKKLANLQVSRPDTKQMKKDVEQAINSGKFDKAQKLLDEISSIEELVGIKALNNIYKLRNILQESQASKVLASVEANKIMVNSRKCKEAYHYFKFIDDEVKVINNNLNYFLAPLTKDILLVPSQGKCEGYIFDSTP